MCATTIPRSHCLAGMGGLNLDLRAGVSGAASGHWRLEGATWGDYWRGQRVAEASAACFCWTCQHVTTDRGAPYIRSFRRSYKSRVYGSPRNDGEMRVDASCRRDHSTQLSPGDSVSRRSSLGFCPCGFWKTRVGEGLSLELSLVVIRVSQRSEFGLALHVRCRRRPPRGPLTSGRPEGSQTDE